MRSSPNWTAMGRSGRGSSFTVDWNWTIVYQTRQFKILEVGNLRSSNKNWMIPIWNFQRQEIGRSTRDSWGSKPDGHNSMNEFNNWPFTFIHMDRSQFFQWPWLTFLDVLVPLWLLLVEIRMQYFLKMPFYFLSIWNIII